MIEITAGTLEEQIIKLLQTTYPITIEELQQHLHVSKKMIMRTVQKLQTHGIVQLDPLPDKTYLRLLRNDFSFLGRKHQKKFVKHHHSSKKQYILASDEEENDIMYC